MKVAICAIVACVASTALGQFFQYQRTFGVAGLIYEGRSIATARGGYVVAGTARQAATAPRQMFVTRHDHAGNIVWSRVYSVPAGEMVPLSIIEAGNGDLVVAGDKAGTLTASAFVMRLTQVGAFIGGIEYQGAPGERPEAATVKELLFGDVVVASRMRLATSVGQLMTMVRVNPAGGVVFAKAYSDSRYSSGLQVGGLIDVEQFPAAVATPVVAVGYIQRTSAAPREAISLFVDPAGNPLTYRTYTPIGATDAYMNNILLLGSGNQFAMAGRYETAFSGNAPGTFFLRADTTFATLGGLTLHPQLYAAADSLAEFAGPTINGSYTLGGHADEVNLPVVDSNAAILRVDNFGSPIYSMHYGILGDERFNQMIQTPDGGFAMAGSERSFSTPSTGVYFVKTDPMGFSGCNERRLASQSSPISIEPVFPQALAVNIVTAQFGTEVTVRTLVERVLCITCPADLNADGAVDFNDYLEFLNLYNSSNPRVDFNNDGTVDFNDYLEFLNLYNSRCP